ncbi:uncharacterized protein LOC141617042 [Silene latifolia]|uniref:uncharacterized protein LOC141617042 n=1 Tax=Silene latifolia TaxID=37657 RepID=UPI003D789AB5
MAMTMSMSTIPMKKERWGEIEEEGDDYSYLLPPKEVTGPDTDGVKTVVEYKFNDEGKKVKITTKTRVVTSKKSILERRSWAKFGDAVNDAPINTSLSLTTVSTEEIKIDRPGSDDKDKEKDKGKDTKADPNQPTRDGTIKICRTCHQKGDHWTAACPYKDLVQSTEALAIPDPNPNPNPNPTATKKYVPPIRNTTTDPRRRNDENSVRVTNLSEDTKEADLQELFEPFGHVTRVYVATDRGTNMSRGFGFVNFARREDAQRAINKLNGYGYDNLILHVEWSAPKA